MSDPAVVSFMLSASRCEVNNTVWPRTVLVDKTPLLAKARRSFALVTTLDALGTVFTAALLRRIYSERLGHHDATVLD